MATSVEPDNHLTPAEEEPSVQVFLRPVGSPLALGMVGLGVASLVQSGFDLHWVAKAQALQVGVILLAVPFLLQGLASIFSLLARDAAAASILGVLGTSWLAIGLVHVTSVPGHRSPALGLLLLTSGAMVALGTLSVGVAKPLPAAVFAIEAARFVLGGIYELGAPGVWRDIAGIAGLVVLAGASYCSLAFELEGQHRRAVLPTLRRGRGKAAVAGSPREAVDDVLHDPGVRQTT